MLQNIFCLLIIVTVVYAHGNCCKTTGLCSDEDKECQLKKYGIYLCDANVEKSIGAFSKDVDNAVRLEI